MSEGFANPIIGGAAALIRAAIKSPNFVHGSAGWSVNKDGTAEFQNATIRGTISASTIIGALIESAASGRRTTLDANGDIKVYNAAGAVLFWFSNAKDAEFYYVDTGSVTQGALRQSVSTVSGTDPFGNAVIGGNCFYQAGSPSRCYQFTAGINFYTAPTQAGPYTVQAAGLGLDTGATTLSGPQIQLTGGPVIATGGTSANLTQISTDTWQAVTLPAGMTGTIRVKLLSEKNMAALDINATITSTSTTPIAFNAGSLPSASYYPTGQRQYDLSVQQQFTATSNASPRVNIPVSGALQLDMPGFAAAGNTCLVSGTIVYPLD